MKPNIRLVYSAANSNGAGGVPPHSPESELAAVGAVLIDPAALDLVATVVEPADFYLEPHRQIFAAAIAVRDAGNPVDVVTVAEELRARGRIAQVGGFPFLTGILDAAPALTTPALRAYAGAVLDCARIRRTVAACQRIAAEGYLDVGEVDVWLANAADRLRDVVSVKTSETLTSNKDKLMELAKKISDRASGHGFPSVATGLAGIDRFTDGLPFGCVTVLAARPNMGKTALATTICANVAGRGVGALLFSLEQSQEEILVRMVSARIGVDSRRVKLGDMNASGWQNYTAAALEISKWPLVVDERSSLTPAQIRATALQAARELAAKGTPLGLIAIDYVQRVAPDPSWSEGTRELPRHEQVARIARTLKPLARDTGCAVLALAQLNRCVERRSEKSKRPNMADIAESGEIEKGADIVALLHRESYYAKNKPDDGTAELIIDKHRDGPTGVVPLAFEPKCARFSDAPQDACSSRFADEDR